MTRRRARKDADQTEGRRDFTTENTEEVPSANREGFTEEDRRARSRFFSRPFVSSLCLYSAVKSLLVFDPRPSALFSASSAFPFSDPTSSRRRSSRGTSVRR